MSIETNKICNRLEENLNQIIRGQSKTIRKVLASFLSGGHVLLEDFPGTGKTTLAKSLARSIEGAHYNRVQFTPDLLPADILGVSVWNPQDHQFEFHSGPIFSNILLADEINRASPRTQSALLEAMAEGQVTIEGKLHVLPQHFFVIATQNPVEFRGTYPLPEAQMDRFAMKCSLGYPQKAEELKILADQTNAHPLDSLEPCIQLSEVTLLKEVASKIEINPELMAYIVDIVSATRGASDVELPASPRASLALMKAAQVLALMDESSFVTPDHIQELAAMIIGHRIVVSHEAKFNGKTGANVVDGIVAKIAAPA